MIHQTVYWIQNTHYYWQIINANWGTTAALSQIKTSKNTGFLAISADIMDQLIEIVWGYMQEAGRVHRYVDVSH